MQVNQTRIKDVLLVVPQVHKDERGYFFESYSAAKFATSAVPDVHFIQDNESFSAFGTIRGLHYQLPPHHQAKLVRVIKGCVLDVALDLRDYSGQTRPVISDESRPVINER